MVVVELLPYDLVDNWMPNFMTSLSFHAAVLQVLSYKFSCSEKLDVEDLWKLWLLTSEEKDILLI